MARCSVLTTSFGSEPGATLKSRRQRLSCSVGPCRARRPGFSEFSEFGMLDACLSRNVSRRYGLVVMLVMLVLYLDNTCVH